MSSKEVDVFILFKQSIKRKRVGEFLGSYVLFGDSTNTLDEESKMDYKKIIRGCFK